MSGGQDVTPAPAPGPTSARSGFGARLGQALRERSRLCVGIDPHPGLLDAWGLPDTAAGLERFTLTVLEAAQAVPVAALKPQVALFERHGSAGFAVLERLLAQARQTPLLTIADAKRGDIGSTMAGYAQAWLQEAAPLAADALTLSPYLGYESLRPAIDLAEQNGRGVFILDLTSNPEGASIQHARGPEGPVARQIAAAAAQDNRNARERAGQCESDLGHVGLVVGATTAGAAQALGVDLQATHSPLLAPGYGAQGATAPGMRRDFGAAWGQVLVPVSRSILSAGPDDSGLTRAMSQALEDLKS